MTIDLIHAKPAQDLGLPPVLLIHGICHQADHWKHIMAELAALGVASYALSLRGHGRSSQGPVPFWRCGSTEYLADIDEVMTKIDQPVVLGGHPGPGDGLQH